MKSCYAIMKHVPISEEPSRVESSLYGLAESLFLSEKMITNYYTENFGEDGSTLVCVMQPGWSDLRRYNMQSHYCVSGTTTFTVEEMGIQDDMALL